MTPAHPFDTDGTPGLRDWRVVMQPDRLSAMQPSRLSGARAFLNKMGRERWDIRPTRFDVDAEGRGTVVYSIKAPGQEFSFIGISFKPEPKGRTGRIIGRSWDMMGTLNEGPATETDIESARDELPRLYRGRATPNALIWCRSNRSMRAFGLTRDALAEGRQPRIGDLNDVCYLMRNTGLDGNGTFGTRPFPALGPDHALGRPLEAQILTAYLMREFSCDLVEHLARLQAPDTAVPLSPRIRRWLGVGNGSALGLIFYIQKHPRLIAGWIEARERAIAAALRLPATPQRVARLRGLIDRAATFREEDRMVYETFAASARVAAELRGLIPPLEALEGQGGYPLRDLAEHAARGTCPETSETLLSLMIELVPETADALAAGIAGEDEMQVDPRRTASEMLHLIEGEWTWATEIDMRAGGAMDYVWYKSESAEEPRRGLRSEVPGARDLGLDVAGDVQRLATDLRATAADTTMARFLLAHPGHRAMVARVQGLAGVGFHTPLANINAADFVPIALVRLMNVTVHGIDKTRDYLNRNLRGVLCHGAPTPDDLRAGECGDWFYPEEPRQ
ncbi:hypothetical protein EKE94_00585 [Mesobaculum littorinae]|uniref:Uncharacterized protein n=1 Tax=Mesobaculum littorinae TaxID=2486419 RepID=A0A438AKN7_9RHOB|nr:hypothetical protein [Mesobaculum littorinae]RVV99229.1 hypothetical protein EKE94_00585 [Mesobaculum littorinae]